MYAILENAVFLCVAVLGLLMALFPGKYLKPALRQSPTGRLVGRIIGVVLAIAGVALFFYFYNAS